jgi:hypothetical protein
MRPLNLRGSSSRITGSGMATQRHVASHLDHHLDPLSLSTLFRSAAAESECVDPIELSFLRLRVSSILYQRDQVNTCKYYCRLLDRTQSIRHLLATLAPSIEHHDAHIGTALFRDQRLRCSRDMAKQTAPGHGSPNIHGISFYWSSPEVR